MRDEVALDERHGRLRLRRRERVFKVLLHLHVVDRELPGRAGAEHDAESAAQAQAALPAEAVFLPLVRRAHGDRSDGRAPLAGVFAHRHADGPRIVPAADFEGYLVPVLLLEVPAAREDLQLAADDAADVKEEAAPLAVRADVAAVVHLAVTPDARPPAARMARLAGDHVVEVPAADDLRRNGLPRLDFRLALLAHLQLHAEVVQLVHVRDERRSRRHGQSGQDHPRKEKRYFLKALHATIVA